MNYERVDELLAQRGMSRRQLANAAGISIDTVSSWFRRQTMKVPMKHIKRIAEVLNVPYWELIIIDDGVDPSAVMLEMISAQSEKQTGYSNKQLITDFRSLSVESQEYIILLMRKIFEEEQAEMQAAYEYYKGEEGNNGTGSERESQRNDHQG